MDLPQCWAYNSNGERCEKHAGHPGQHAITRSWTDDQCAAPATNKPQGRPLMEVFAEEETKQPSKCIACKHMHRDGVCKCGCHEHIG